MLLLLMLLLKLKSVQLTENFSVLKKFLFVKKDFWREMLKYLFFVLFVTGLVGTVFLTRRVFETSGLPAGGGDVTEEQETVNHEG